MYRNGNFIYEIYDLMYEAISFILFQDFFGIKSQGEVKIIAKVLIYL